ncbi:basic proline-rich protein-like [Hippopotamus amphibius kiboko]|uniref:basic proline-rich protein-like n=1 Tax=Hippopotamus amphibius kiboko TaxID=575201 RepID=UPI002599D657|nr:basic proline-rich protein-like [Hippopotamus amphibius kiboko]
MGRRRPRRVRRPGTPTGQASQLLGGRPQPGTPPPTHPGQAPSLPEGASPQGPAAAGPSEKRGRLERRSRTSDPSAAPRSTRSSGRKLSAARAWRPAGRMTKFGRAPRRRLPFMADSPAADVAAGPPRPGAAGTARRGQAAAGGCGRSPRGPPILPPPLYSRPHPARPSLPDLLRGKLRPTQGRSPAKVTSHHGGVAPEDTHRPCFSA